MAPLLAHYVVWHYSRALLDLLRIWGNFLWFFTNFFSIFLLFRTLLQPFHRLDGEYKKGLDIGAWAEQFGVNLLMRLIGALLRLFMISLGLLSLVFTVLAGVFFFVVWLFAPFIVIALFASGLTLLIAY